MSIDLEISVQFDTFPGKQNYKKIRKALGDKKGLGGTGTGDCPGCIRAVCTVRAPKSMDVV